MKRLKIKRAPLLPPRNVTPHCGNHCWYFEYSGKDYHYHYHGNAKRHRPRKEHWPRPDDGFGGRVADRDGMHRRIRGRERRGIVAELDAAESSY